MNLSREDEGFFNVLINKHLSKNEIKFREFFRVNNDQFSFLLSLVQNELTLPPSNRITKPITP